MLSHQSSPPRDGLNSMPGSCEVSDRISLHAVRPDATFRGDPVFGSVLFRGSLESLRHLSNSLVVLEAVCHIVVCSRPDAKPPAQPGVAVEFLPDKQLVDEAFVWRGHASLLLHVLQGPRGADVPPPHDVCRRNSDRPRDAEGTVDEHTAGLLGNVLSGVGPATSSLIVSLCVKAGAVPDTGSVQLIVDKLACALEVPEDIVRAGIVNEYDKSVLNVEQLLQGVLAALHEAVCRSGLGKRSAMLRDDRDNCSDLELFQGPLALNAIHVAYEKARSDLVDRDVLGKVCHDEL